MIKHADGIYEIKDFLTDNELKDILISAGEDGFFESHPGNIIQNLKPESLNHIPAINDRLLSYFDNAVSLTKINNIRRLKANEYMNAHTDDTDGGYPRNSLNQELEQAVKKVVFGIVIYLNDDFTGGQISYPNLGLKIQPQKSSLIIHDAKILHEVLPVIDGNRYSLTSFVIGDSQTTIRI